MKKLIVFCMVLILHTPCTSLADIIILKDGSKIEGIANEEGNNIRVTFEYGHILYPKSLVKEIIRKDTPQQEYEKKLSQISSHDTEELETLLEWCRRKKLDKQAKELALKIAKLNLEKKTETLDMENSNAIFEMALWCKRNGYEDSLVEYYLWKVIKADKDNEVARKMLGFRKFRGQWLLKSEIDEILELEYEKEMRLKGMVKYNGQWLKPNARNYIIKLEDLEKQKEALERERENLEYEKKEISRTRDELYYIERQLNLEKSELREREEELERLSLHQAIISQRHAFENRELKERKKELDKLEEQLRDKENELEEEREELDDEKKKVELLKLRLESELRRLRQSQIDEDDRRSETRGPIKKEKTVKREELTPERRSDSKRDDYLSRKRRIRR